jgi:hypothetical protein
MIHPSNIFEHAASPKASTRIMNGEKLELLRNNISNFINALCSSNKTDDVQTIRSQLMSYKLRADEFCDTYTTGFSIK